MSAPDPDMAFSPSATHRFFIYDPQGNGFCYFATAEARDAAKNNVIQAYLDDDWDEDVEQVVAGELTHTCKKVGIEHRPGAALIDDTGHDAEGTYWGDWAYRCNYDLLPLLEPVPTPGALIHVGWQWTMHQELGQRRLEFAPLGTDGVNPFGVPDVDHSPEYAVTRSALYAGRDAVIYPGVKA